MNPNYLFHKMIATGFGSGYCPWAPGTAGAALAVAIWFALSCFLSPQLLWIITILLIILFTGLGIVSAGVMESIWGKDPSRVVVDEMVGVWIPLLAVGDGHIGYALVAFVLFRLFDIFKPLGIKKMELLKGGMGIMMDDIVAGIYSLTLLLGARWLIG
jgi:phosphatidylglycerophosphatase A